MRSMCAERPAENAVGDASTYGTDLRCEEQTDGPSKQDWPSRHKRLRRQMAVMICCRYLSDLTGAHFSTRSDD
jgi:hypothetical protein